MMYVLCMQAKISDEKDPVTKKSSLTGIIFHVAALFFKEIMLVEALVPYSR